MDYYLIGQRIRKARKAQGLSQEELAERINISTTHMSHIETGSTKLSLAVFADIARALKVKADDLLTDRDAKPGVSLTDDMADVLSGCSAAEARIISDVVKAIKKSMDRNL